MEGFFVGRQVSVSDRVKFLLLRLGLVAHDFKKKYKFRLMPLHSVEEPDGKMGGFGQTTNQTFPCGFGSIVVLIMIRKDVFLIHFLFE